ncbi:MAG: ParB/RepB/Spo0J family partition protein [Elusimicrobia bacterium]|nr:ParB/RepB/Spo0J family partition protein [Elusimicrobiota bacterium]
MRQALGKGLDALLPKIQQAPDQAPKPFKVPIGKIRPNHMQPRKNFDPERLSELAATIKEYGIAQPIVVTYDESSKTYEIVAGERRLRAAELAGLKEVDVVVRSVDTDRKRLALALIENLQREGLNPIEEAHGYLRLMKEAQINQSQLTSLVGKSKSAISNTLRLLELPEDMQKALEFGRITEGHARALLMVADPMEKQRLFAMLLEHKMSVRELEDLARSIQDAPAQAPAPVKRSTSGPSKEKSPEIRDMENNLQHLLGTKVEIKTRKDPSAGTISIHYYSTTDFDRILDILNK